MDKLNLLKKGESLVVGDFVDLDFNDESGEYIIVKLEDRKNEIFRMIVRERKRKMDN